MRRGAILAAYTPHNASDWGSRATSPTVHLVGDGGVAASTPVRPELIHVVPTGIPFPGRLGRVVEELTLPPLLATAERQGVLCVATIRLLNCARRNVEGAHRVCGAELRIQWVSVAH